MHLGNIYTAVMSWLSAKSKGGKWILRIEDLDPQRSKLEFAKLIEDDLLWLGLHWDEGGIDNLGPNGPYVQSQRSHLYSHALSTLERLGLTYRCTCRRADILASQAPHESDGRVIYKGTCRPRRLGGNATDTPATSPGAIRLYMPDVTVEFTDRFCGPQSVNLACECGDFILRRADGTYAYQLAVVVDDALMGVTEVVRGNDLLLSAAQQIHLYHLLGYEPPEFAHLPLICNDEGIRLSKRDASLSMEALRATHSPEQLLGRIAHLAGLQPTPDATSLSSLLTKTSQ